jgi:hypothetical protein
MSSFANVNVNFDSMVQETEVKPMNNTNGLLSPSEGQQTSMSTTATTADGASPKNIKDVESPEVSEKKDEAQEKKVEETKPEFKPVPSFEHDTGSPDGFEVFVGRMPLSSTQATLLEMAAPFSPIGVRVLSKPDRSSHLCGFVVFKEINKAQGFIAGYNGRMMVGGHYPLNVRFADGKSRKKVFIGGLAMGTRDEDVRALTSCYGTILAIKILSKNQKAPCGFVTFATGEQAAACIKFLHDTPNADDTKKYVVKLAKCPEVDRENKNGQKRGREGGFDNNKRRRGNHKGSNFAPMMDFNSNYNSQANSIHSSAASSPNMGYQSRLGGNNGFQTMQPDVAEFLGVASRLGSPNQMQQPTMVFDSLTGQMVPLQNNMMLQQQQMQQMNMMQQQQNFLQARMTAQSSSPLVYLHNLPKDVQVYQVQQLLSIFGDVSCIEICQEPNGNAMAVITFFNLDSAKIAMGQLDGSYLAGHATPLRAALASSSPHSSPSMQQPNMLFNGMPF